MFDKINKKITGKISNILRSAIKKEIDAALPIIPQLIEFQNRQKEHRQSFYDKTKDPLGNIEFYASLKERLLSADVPVESVSIDIPDFENWLDDYPEIRKHYENMGNVFIEKCLEHYLAFKYLNISAGNVYIDVASSGSPWADILNARGGVKAYRLDLAYPEGIHGIDIGEDAGDTKLPDDFASILSLQCAYECFMGDADIRFIKEAERILNERGRYGILPLYLSDKYFVSSSPYCDQSKVVVENEALRVWRDDKYKVPFSRHYSPEGFVKRIYSKIPETMSGKVLHFTNIDGLMKHYPGQRIYCFFMFLCQKKTL